jgi:flagellar basal-body rod protein FlgG
LGNFTYGNQIDEVYKSFDQGILYDTSKETDFAIIGNGFFTLQMDNGQLAYTRNGNFMVNEENHLTTMEGHLVVGGDSKGNIADGNSSLMITDFDDYSTLVSIGDTLFTSNAQGREMPIAEVRQGFLELSNVQTIDEIVKLIQISREFESNQKALHTADETLSKAVNEIGRV